jgi:hypothetical protein
MLELIVLGTEMYNETLGEFTTAGDISLELEHSLVSLSKWESEFEKPFLSNETKTTEEIYAYVKFMTMTPNVPEEVFHKLSEANYVVINEYIDKKMTATTIHEAGKPPRTREIITSELIYYWLTVFNIPFECETWHLNRLFTLIRICNLKQTKPKKLSRSEAAQRQRDLNAQRRQRTNSTG